MQETTVSTRTQDGSPARSQRVAAGDVKAYIDSHFHERVTGRSMALTFGRSQQHLERVFKSAYGFTLHRYVRARRLERAAILRDQGCRVEAAALMVGYRNKASLYRRESVP